MPAHSYVVVLIFLALLAEFVIHYLRIGITGVDLIGDPPIEMRYFVAGKVAFLTTWALFLLKALRPEIGYLFLPGVFSWIAVCILMAGFLIMTVALFQLGDSLRMGLPIGETRLQTRGIYRVSRNPVYVGVLLISTASCLYFPDLINVVFTLFTIYIHHLIIKREERFLAERFGSAWILYSARVSRYL